MVFWDGLESFLAGFLTGFLTGDPELLPNPVPSRVLVRSLPIRKKTWHYNGAWVYGHTQEHIANQGGRKSM